VTINAIEFFYRTEQHQFLRTHHIRFRLAKIKDISYQKKKLRTQLLGPLKRKEKTQLLVVLQEEACFENKILTNQQAINYLGSS